MRRCLVSSNSSRQQGQTLIGLLVGVLISLVTIAAMLVLYKTLIEVSANASRSALRDGQVSSALLSAQIELQQAGFGVPLTDALDTKIVITESGKQVAWRYKPSLAESDFVCAGIRLVDIGDSRGLYRLIPKTCSTVMGLTWAVDQRQLLAGNVAFFEPLQKNGLQFDADAAEAGAMSLRKSDGDPGYLFSLTSASCLPYMQQDLTLNPLPASAQRLRLASSSLDEFFSICLPNLVVTS